MIQWLWPYDMHKTKFCWKYYEKWSTHIMNICCQKRWPIRRGTIVQLNGIVLKENKWLSTNNYILWSDF